MIKSEAVKLIKQKNKNDPEWFCPLIKTRCEKTCINYNKGFVYNPNISPNEILVNAKRADFEIQTAYCSNAMFIETILECPHGKKDE
jgi:hypothetical protein